MQRTVESSSACAPPSPSPSDPIAAAVHDDGDEGGLASAESNIGHASISDGSLAARSSAAVLPLSDGQHAVDPDDGSAPMAAFDEGSRVFVSGLVAAAQHNGKAGTVLTAVDPHTARLHVLLDDGVSIKVRPSNLLAWSGVVLRAASSPPITVPSPPHDFPMLGLPPSFLRTFIEANGGEAAFHGLTTSHVRRQMIVPLTLPTTLSLCEQMRQQSDCRVQTATWFVSHPWQIQFLDLVSALESFFAEKPAAVIWLDLISTSQHSTFDRPPEWWQQTFVSAIGRIGQMVMVMTPWDNPVCLTRAWCLIELYACRSSGSRFDVALPPSERARFLEQIAEYGAAFYGMLAKVNTAKSECSRDSDRERIFAAVRGLEGGFTGLDRSVLHSMTEWLQRQLQQEMQHAVATGRGDCECRMMSALGVR